MPRYLYKAKKGPGEVVEGQIDADSETHALSKITALGFYPLLIKEVQETPFFGRIKTSDLAVFTRQLADLLGSGLTILNSLDILSKQTENKRLKKIIAQLGDYIKSGNTLAVSMSRYPSVFSPLYVSMIRSGEASGSLETVLNRISDFLEAQEDFKAKVHTALAYPILLASVGAIVVVVLLTFVVPRVIGIFEDLGQQLPLITLILLAVSKFIKNYWYIAIAFILLLLFLVRQMAKSHEGKAFLDRLKSGLPLIGPLLQKTDIARFAATLGTLLNNGVAILQSLEISEGIVSSELAKRELREAFVKVRDGVSLAKALAEGSYFPLFVTNMITVGEESGQLEQALLKVADSYERETSRVIKLISNLIEPLIILTMGLIVGFIVVAILLPIFQISLIAR